MPEFDTIDELANFMGVEPDELRGGLNLSEAAPLLGIGISTLRSTALNGRIGYRRAGRRWIFGWRDIADYIQREHQSPRLPSEQQSSIRIPGEKHSHLRGGHLGKKDLEEAKKLGLL